VYSPTDSFWAEVVVVRIVSKTQMETWSRFLVIGGFIPRWIQK
jgi:hypothetical protein